MRIARDFMAQYAGTCPACDQDIRPGQRVIYRDDVLEHVTCPPPPATCPTCHLTLPVTGVCGNCT